MNECAQIAPRVGIEMICPHEPGRPLDEVGREFGLERMINLASNENPLGPSAKVLDTLNHTDLELHMYPDSAGWKLVRDLARHVGVAVEQIVLGAGSVEVLRFAADAFLSRDDEALLFDVCFPVYATVCRLAGAHPVVVPLDDQLDADLQRVRDAVTPRTKIVFLGSPNNPTGRSIPLTQIGDFLEILPQKVLCVLDLAYREYDDQVEDATLLRLLTRFPNLLALRTFSKVYGLAGLRIGYGVTSREVAAHLQRVRIPFSCSTAAQVAARVALQDQEHVQRSVALNREALAVATRAFGELGGRAYPSRANFLLVDFGVDATALFNGLLRRGIVVRPVGHPRLRSHLRITTGTLEQVDVLSGALHDELRTRR